MNASITGKTSGKDFDYRLTVNDHDIWIEVVKPDFAAQSSEGPEDVVFFPSTGTGNSIDRKLNKDFQAARQHLPDDAILVLALYTEVKTSQQFQTERWLNEEYYDVSNYSDGWLFYTHLTPPTDFDYYWITENGRACHHIFDQLPAKQDDYRVK